MIPKTIHYCWFGGNQLPVSAVKCIASWRKFLPGYEIKQWDESNFDVNIIPYTAEAYEAKKYAFVSDYARFWILYRHGGLYFDTDVEVIKPMDDILARGPFMGIEVNGNGTTLPMVAPGLGLGAEAGMAFYREVLDYYRDLHFLDDAGRPNPVTVVTHNTIVLKRHGLRTTDELQQVADIWIYPRDYFNPLDDLTGRLNTTGNTRSVHWYSRTWSDSPVWRIMLSRWSHRLFGMSLHRLRNCLGI